MRKINEIKWEAESGKVFNKKNTNIIGGNLLLLGKNDNISNYEEVDKPVVEEPEIIEE